MNVAIYCQKRDPESVSYLETFVDCLIEKGVHVILHEDLRTLFHHPKLRETFKNKKELEASRVDRVFSFGGDGTILDAMTFVQDLHLPIVGINLGRLGFLATFSKEQALTHLDDLLNGNTTLSKRSVLEISSRAEIAFPFALNDLSITRKETTSMIHIETYLGGQLLTDFWADGLIVATPTGSTAYSLSCGGPLIDPSTDNFVMTPIAPHNLNARPIVLKDDIHLTMKVQSRVPQYSLSLDSRLYSMNVEDEIQIKKAAFKVHLVQPKDLSFYDTLHQKLYWGKDKRH